MGLAAGRVCLPFTFYPLFHSCCVLELAMPGAPCGHMEPRGDVHWTVDLTGWNRSAPPEIPFVFGLHLHRRTKGDFLMRNNLQALKSLMAKCKKFEKSGWVTPFPLEIPIFVFIVQPFTTRPSLYQIWTLLSKMCSLLAYTLAVSIVMWFFIWFFKISKFLKFEAQIHQIRTMRAPWNGVERGKNAL